ncbi:MAG: LEA type 2 family protein [Spirochaetia bacterium]|jgi:LEA14-like dessication related protein
MKRYPIVSLACGLLVLLAGCASQEGPVEGKAPTVSVSEFTSVSFTPKLMKFQAKVLVGNTMASRLDLSKVDYAVDLYDEQLFVDSFNGVKPVNAEGTETVTFPFQIAMADLMAQAPALLAEGNLRVTFRGQLLTAAKYDIDPIPFQQSLTIPIPRVPDVVYTGSQGEPFSSSFRLNFQVTNTNSFPFTLTDAKTFLEINEHRYSLLRTRDSVEVKPGETATVTLRMENAPGKALGMALDLIQHPNPEFDITGSVTFDTPYGWIYIPLSLRETLRQ